MEAITRSAYGYAGNNPANMTDPTGMCWPDSVCEAIGGVVEEIQTLCWDSGGNDSCDTHLEENPEVRQGIVNAAGAYLDGVTNGHGQGLNFGHAQYKDPSGSNFRKAGVAGSAVLAVGLPIVYGAMTASVGANSLWDGCGPGGTGCTPGLVFGSMFDVVAGGVVGICGAGVKEGTRQILGGIDWLINQATP